MIRFVATVLLLVLPTFDAGAMEWRSSLDADHPLVGRIWDTRTGAFIDEASVTQEAAGARHVLLGERHDNPDHHALQARVLAALVASGRRPAVVWEMLSLDDQPVIDAHLAAAPTDVDGLATAVDWGASGWPDWEIYAPIARVALENGLTIRAAGLDRDAARILARQGLDALPADLARRLAGPDTVSEAGREAMLDALFTGHCELVPREHLAPMLSVQVARDAALASVMAEVAGTADENAGGTVLIAGAGHARRDVGAPHHLARLGAEGSTFVVAFVEVATDLADPAEYRRAEDGTRPFDVLWFTPRWSDEDECEKLRQRFKK